MQPKPITKVCSLCSGLINSLFFSRELCCLTWNTAVCLCECRKTSHQAKCGVFPSLITRLRQSAGVYCYTVSIHCQTLPCICHFTAAERDFPFSQTLFFAPPPVAHAPLNCHHLHDLITRVRTNFHLAAIQTRYAKKRPLSGCCSCRLESQPAAPLAPFLHRWFSFRFINQEHVNNWNCGRILI